MGYAPSMRRGSDSVVSGWAAILLAPIFLPIALLVGIWETVFPTKGRDRTPAEVVGFIQDLIDGTGGDWDWDEFECVKIRDSVLETFRRRAARMGPPGADLEGLRRIVAELRERFPGAD